MKRIIAFMLCMMLAMSSVSFTFAENADNSYEVERALGILNAIGRFTEYDMTTIDQTQHITRGEFAQELAGLLKLGISGEKLYYHDVSKEHFAYEGITALTENGITSGCGNSRFEPDRIMSKNEAATALVAALGYKKEAVVKGGDELAFARIAQRLGIFDSTTENISLTFGDMLVMFSNSLITPVLETKVFGKTVVYTENDNETLLSVYYDSRYVKNQRVTFANNTSIYGDKGNKDSVKIGDKEYSSTFTNMELYLGSYVNFIYKKGIDGMPGEIFWIENSNMYDEIIISGDKIGGFNPSTYTYSYYTETGKAKSVSLSGNVSVIYNGRFEADSEKYLKLPCDEIKFVADKNNNFDIAIISNYENYVIDTIYGADMVFTVKGNNTKINKINIDTEDYEEFTVLDAEGNIKSTDDLASDIVVSVFESSDEKYKKLIISDDTAEGIVNSINKRTNRPTKLTLNGVEYEVSKGVDTDTISPGDDVFVYLDYNGRIAYINNNYTSVYLAYITGFATEGIFAAESKIKAFTQEGKFEVYETNEKLRIDGKTYTNPDSDDIAEINGKIINKLAILEFDKKGRIRSIDAEGKENDEGILKISADYASCNYRSVSPKLGKLTCIDSTTKIFGVPDKPQTADESEFRVMNKSQLGDWRTFYAQSYNYSDATAYAQAVVIQGFDWNAPTDTSIAFVYEGNYQVINAEGDAATVIYGFVGADEKEYYCENGFDVNTLTAGSGVFLSLNSKNEVRGIEPVFDKTSTGGESNTNLSASRRIVVGYVGDKQGTVISVGYTDPKVIDEKFDCVNTPVIVVDETEEDVVSLGSVADIVTYKESPASGYSKIAVQTIQLSQKMIVVYK